MAAEISSDCFVRRCQIPSPYASPYTSPYPPIPNQLNSTLSSSSSHYSSDSDQEEAEESQETGGIRSHLELEDYMNDSALSVDGEFDVRIVLMDGDELG